MSKQHKPDEEKRTMVKSLSAMGIRYEDIAKKLSISDDTLRKYYKLELDLGRIEANAKMANALFQQGINGSVPAAIFWLKTRAGWKETQTMEHVGDSLIKVITGIDEPIETDFESPENKLLTQNTAKSYS